MSDRGRVINLASARVHDYAMNLAAVSEQPPGSDTHGLVENVAYRVWKTAGFDDPDPNWSAAKRAVAEWLTDAVHIPAFWEPPEALSHYLQVSASYKQTGDELMDWKRAQEEVAERVIAHALGKALHL